MIINTDVTISALVQAYHCATYGIDLRIGSSDSWPHLVILCRKRSEDERLSTKDEHSDIFLFGYHYVLGLFFFFFPLFGAW